MDLPSIWALVHSYSAVIGPLSFAIAFLGCLLGPNLLVPAGAFLTAMGVLVGAGIFSWTIVVWAACGAVVGLSGSYSIGLRLGASVRRMSLLRRWPDLMDRAEALFLRYGFAAILIAYLSGPLRAPVAAVAAIAGMRRVPFELANLVSAFVWAAFSVCLGAAPGTLIDPNSPWLLIAPFLVPLITVGISIIILLLQKTGRATAIRPHQRSPECQRKGDRPRPE